jgi:GTP-binding protein EngB required for normal cell division
MLMSGTFNESQKSRILAGVSYMDKLLISVEEVLAASSSEAFPKYKNALTPVQVRTTRDYMKRLRQQTAHVLKDLEIPLPDAKFDSTHSVRVALQFIEVAIEELSPERLTGYGEVPHALIGPLAGGLQEMKGIVRQMDSYLIQRPDADLSGRVARLFQTGALAELLTVLSSVIERHGFVEFRGPLSRLVAKIETPTYEIAFFGRVSAGKSSLLNRIVGADLLPTGVTPVTAVPTRIRNRQDPALLVWKADGRFDRHEIARLPDFVTEARNPRNFQRVIRLIAEMPLAMLPEEVVLVDTPGLGSLALEGAAETLAYLPHCDLGVVLVDASSNLHSDDVATLDALRTASVPSLVVLSKADLVAPEDLERLVDYTRNQVAQQLGSAIDVAPLSSRPEMSHLLQKWVTDQITPRITNARRLAEESNQRKINTLGYRVLHALEMSVRTARPGEPASAGSAWRNAESQLRETAGIVESTNDRCFRITGQIREAARDIIAVLTGNAITLWQNDKTIERLDEAWLTRVVNQVAQNEAEQLARLIQGTAKSLSQALELAAQATSAGKRVEQFSLDGLVKELPVPDFSGCLINLHRPRLLSISIAVVRHSVARQIESDCGAFLDRFFNSYGRALELWFRNILSDIQREFNNSADVYRAQLQRLATPGATTAEPVKNLVLEDISALKQTLGLSDPVDQTEAHVMV